MSRMVPGSGFSWLTGRQDPELASLHHWLDTVVSTGGQNRASNQIGVSAGIIFGVGGALMGATGAFLHDDPRRVLIGFGATMGTTLLVFGITTATILLRRTPAEREAARAFAGNRNFVWQLQMARWSGGIRSVLGDDRALALNQGASAYLRAREALGNPAWKSVAPDTEFAATRSRTETAVEVAMARLVTVIGQGQNSQSPEVLNLLRDMTETADEATRAAERLARDSGRPGDASENLRQVLSEMRLLNSAQDEIDQLRDRSR